MNPNDYPPNGINFPCVPVPFKGREQDAIESKIDEACNLIGAINATALPLVKQLIALCDEWHVMAPSLEILQVINDLEVIKAKVIRSEERRKAIEGAK